MNDPSTFLSQRMLIQPIPYTSRRDWRPFGKQEIVLKSTPMLNHNLGMNLAHRIAVFSLVVIDFVGFYIVSDSLIEVTRPLFKLGFEMRPWRSVLPLVLVPLAVDADLGCFKAVASNPKELVALCVDHSRETAGLEGQKLDRGVGVEEVDGSQTENSTQVDC